MAKMRTTSGKVIEVRVRELNGRRVRTRRAMRNGYMTIPADTDCEVSGTWRSGVSLDGPPCPHCGVRVRICQVHRDDVLLIDDDEQEQKA